MSKGLLGAMIGLQLGSVLGLLDAIAAYRTPLLAPWALNLFLGGMVKGLLTGGVAGVVAGRTRSFSPTFAAGVLSAAIFTMLAWIVTRDLSRPPLLPAIALGGATAVAAFRWGR